MARNQGRDIEHEGPDILHRQYKPQRNAVVLRCREKQVVAPLTRPDVVHSQEPTPVKNSNRRVFFMQVAAGSSLLATSQAMAQAALPKVDEKEPQAAALGYVKDSTKADKKKFPKHTAEQKCDNCQLYTGKPKEASGPCTLFPGKQVEAPGWCSAWVKKA
jgi:High potential iron-sulfur protein